MRALSKKISLHIPPVKIYNFVNEIYPKNKIDKKICIYLSGFLENFLRSIMDEAVSLARRCEKNMIDCDILYDTFETKQIFNYIVSAPSDETLLPSE
jgi:histone H3/H4